MQWETKQKGINKPVAISSLFSTSFDWWLVWIELWFDKLKLTLFLGEPVIFLSSLILFFFIISNKILILDSLGIFPKNSNPNVVLITQSPKINLDRLLTLYHPTMIVADGSNFKSYVKRWKSSCAKMKIPFHATAEKGFYKIEK